MNNYRFIINDYALILEVSNGLEECFKILVNHIAEQYDHKSDVEK